MEEILLLDAIERYLNGEMTDQEKVLFESLRKSNPEVDQAVVEHTYFLHGLDKYGAAKNFKHNLLEVEAKLDAEGAIAAPQLKGKAKIIQLWDKYKKNVAVAASIAGFISLITLGLMVPLSKKYSNEGYQYLVKEINKTNEKVNRTDEKINKLETTTINKHNNKDGFIKPEPKVDFRGTGFLIDGKGYLVTNAHVINKMKNVYVENNKGDYFSASAIYTDNNVDLAILKINDTAFKTVINIPYNIKKGNSDLGEEFFTLGFPRNEIVYGEGYVSARSGNDGDTAAYQLTVSANPGNSGGPVVNKNGEIIGIITGKDAKADGVVYATKSKNIFKLVDQLKKLDIKEQSVKTPSGNALKGIDRVQQVKKMQEYVYMVVGN